MSDGKLKNFLIRSFLPAMVFIAVAVIHFVWVGLHPEENPAQSRWVPVDDIVKVSWWHRYLASSGVYLGYSYALSLSFASIAIRNFQEKKFAQSRNMAFGGITLTGFLAVAGCFLIGCCGSPMFGVYLSLFGAGFLPFTGPLIAGLTTVFIAGSWAWMIRSQPSKSTFCDC